MRKVFYKKQKAEGRKQKGNKNLTVLWSYGLMVLLLFSCFALKAQLSTKELPYTWEKGRGEITISLIPIAVLPNLDMETIQREDLMNDGSGTPYRFGFTNEVSLSLTNSGVWKTTSDGGRLWTLRIYSPDALSLNLLYDQFWLPDGAKFFLYSEDMTQSIGAFTSRNNKGSRENIRGFATSFLFTNSIVLEYYEPEGISDNGIISISKIVSGYRSVYDSKSRDISPEEKIECLININCPIAEEWQKEKNAIALMIIGNGSCSGALLNTTANDNAPIFLSANHCFVGAEMYGIEPEQWMFIWNFEHSNCKYLYLFNPESSSNKSTIGANLLAKREDTDFLLLKLDEDPADNNEIALYYLGWDRDTVHPAGGQKACIHHPRNYSKSFAYTSWVIESNPNIICWGKDIYGNCTQGISLPHTHWEIEFDKGITIPGSSGSPIMNVNKRVIGQLHGAWDDCPKSKKNGNAFGRFDLSWNGRTSATRLKDWLDPLGKDLPYINGRNYCITSFTNRTIETNTNIVGCDYLNVQDVNILSGVSVVITAGEEITLKANFHAVAGSDVSISINSRAKTEHFSQPYFNDLTTTDETAPYFAMNNTDIASKYYYCKLFPNPNLGAFQIETNFPLSDVASLKVVSSLGAPVYETQNLAYHEIQLLNSGTGLYFVVIILKNGTVLTQKMMVQR